MNGEIYRQFEDNFRGSRELIIERLRIYLPFVLPLKGLYPDSSSVDLGCGRGEWLQLLTEKDVNIRGIDLDESMLQACRDLGLSAEQGDAIEALLTLPDDSQALVTAFHVVEHIQFEQLQRLVLEALRVLRPGGLLVMETPNPENIIVATRNFYLDPLHQRPIPSDLLAFLSEYYGFRRTKVLGLQESPALVAKTSPSLGEVLEGASSDYAVVAQKDAPDELLVLFDQPWAKDYGLSLRTLSDRFSESLASRLEQVAEQVARAEDQVSQSNQRAAQIEALARNAIERSEELENRISRLQPKFWIKRIRTVGKQGLRRVLVPIVLKIREYPRFYRVIISPLNDKPKLRSSLKRNIFGKPGKVHSWASKAEREAAVRQLLSSRALEVYDELAKAIESTKRSGDK